MQAPTTPTRPITTSMTTPPPAPERPNAQAVLQMRHDQLATLVDDLHAYLAAIVNGDQPMKDPASLLVALEQVFPSAGGA